MDSLHLITPVDIPNAHLWPRLRHADWRFDGDGKLSLFIDGQWQRMDGFRWALRGVGAFPAQSVMLGVLAATVLLFTGFFYFHRTEDTFADFI